MTPSGGGGSLTMMCPHTGSIHSSFRGNADMSGKAALGMSSVSLFPRKFSSANSSHNSNNSNNNVIAMAYGKNVSKSTDTYAMLLTLRTSTTSPPILHWKCRLPEANLTAGLVVSPCGYYIAGGGASGTCFIWSSILGGKLLKIFKSHYRSCTSLVWSDCGKYLLTGGADGMVHVYSLLDLVDQSSNSSKSSQKLQQQQQEQSVPPFHTWSIHHLPVTCLTTLDSGRVASSSDDGQVVVMELFSRTVVTTIQLPHGIRCLDHHDGRLLAGSNHGEIYTMDLNAHAMRQTINQGGGGATSNTKRRRVLHPHQESLEDTIFGGASLLSSDPSGAGTAAAATDAPYYQPLQGHDRPVTALALLVEGDLQERLISGDELGTIRIWDMASRTCLRVVQPWSHSTFNNAVTTKAKATTGAGAGAADTSTTSQQQQRHPVTSIQILRHDTESAFTKGRSGGSLSGGMLLGHSSSGNSSESILSLLTPLQRFTTSEDQDNSIPIPFLKPLGTLEEMEYWKVDASYPETYHRKPFQANDDEDSLPHKKEEGNSSDKAKLEHALEEQRQQIEQLQKELAERTSQVERWENVNNKLMAKLEAGRK
jgi:WD40 repeat protein